MKDRTFFKRFAKIRWFQLFFQNPYLGTRTRTWEPGPNVQVTDIGPTLGRELGPISVTRTDYFFKIRTWEPGPVLGNLALNRTLLRDPYSGTWPRTQVLAKPKTRIFLNSCESFFRKSPFCTFSWINPGFGGPWDMLWVFFLIPIFIMLQKNAFGQKIFLNSMHRFKSAILAKLKNCQNGTFEPVHEIQNFFGPKAFFWSIRKMAIRNFFS